MRKTGRVLGHVDRLDATGVTGWALGSTSLPRIVLRVGGKDVVTATQRVERPDIAAIYGPSALEAGFHIDLREIAPKDDVELKRFFRTLEVRADGKKIKPSNNATMPWRPGRWRSPTAAVRSALPGRDSSSYPPEEYEEYFLRPTRLAKLHGRDLRAVSDRTRRIGRNDILVFVTCRNEKLRIPYFLKYYRQMGVGHFLFVDNDSDDGLIDLLREQDDCSVWHTTASYKVSNFGVHWMNYLLHTYGTGHWCLTLDPDEFLVFPHCETRNLGEMTEFMQAAGQPSLFAVLLDMYSDRRVSETIYREDQDPLEIAAYFDLNGYVQTSNSSYGEMFIRGGPRRRIFFRDRPDKAPAINKTPLVKWKSDYNYLSSTHVLAPRGINIPHRFEHLSVTGCLLHFKFISSLAEKAAEELERKEHYDDSIEYMQYDAVISNDDDLLHFDKSIRYAGSRQLCDLGLMTSGRWF